MKLLHRWRTQALMAAIIVLGIYLMFARGRHNRARRHFLEEAQSELSDMETDLRKHVVVATYQPPKEDRLAWVDNKQAAVGEGMIRANDNERTLQFHRTWMYAAKVTNMHELFSNTPDIETVLTALAEARIVFVDVLDPEPFESGTSEKWVITLEGGQKAMMKLYWGEPKGDMKRNGECNLGHEMPWAEIAAFHLHRILGFRNTPYATGRKVDLRREILPVASPAVSRQIQVHSDSKICVTGMCFHCKKVTTLCPPNGILDASIVYWVPRRLQHWTIPPGYMPFSTPNMPKWKKYGFNNKTYCEQVRKHDPYTNDRYYHDLFDFAVIDTLMYHYDSKHYILTDDTNANGLTVRLDHGRAFCAHDRDLDDIFLAPLTQCCILRRETYWALKVLRPGQLSDRLRLELGRDPLAPILNEAWYPALERRLVAIINAIDKCTEAVGGLNKMLVG